MNLIIDDTRAEQTEKGLFFYETDIAFLPYLFVNDFAIDIEVEYNYPGIGFCIVKNSGKPILENETAYLVNCDENKVTLLKKLHSLQTIEGENTCLLEPKSELTLLRFSKKGNIIRVESGDRELSEFVIEEIDSFYFGIFSQANNTISSISIKESCPQYWFSSISNTEGGRISFKDSRIIIENCLHDAEIEQTNIELEAGTYFLKYALENINEEENNIEVFLFEANDGVIFDRNKNLLGEDNKFSLKEKTKVAVRIRGNNGIVKDICITEKATNPYIPTYDEIKNTDGSMIMFDLTRIAEIEMDLIISDIPNYELKENANYFIVEQPEQNILMEDLLLLLEEEYKIVFQSESNILNVYNKKGEVISSCTLKTEDYLKMLYNVTATILSLTVWNREGEKIDITIQKTFKKYVPGYLTTPIIIVDNNEVPLELSSTYREAIVEDTQIDIVRSDAWKMSLSKTLMPNKPVTVYGLSNHAIIRAGQNTISDTCAIYEEISNDDYSIDYEYNKIVMSEAKKKEFDNFAIVYIHMDNILYWFTNYERILTNSNSTEINLPSKANSASGAIIVYGIKNRDSFNEDNLYKIFNYRSETSIECATNEYDQLSELSFILNEDCNMIEIEKDIASDYEFFVVDYLKEDSYAINYLTENDQYEVDISTTKDKVTMLYDMSKDGAVTSYKSVDIVPTSSKYITLRKE